MSDNYLTHKYSKGFIYSPKICQNHSTAAVCQAVWAALSQPHLRIHGRSKSALQKKLNLQIKAKRQGSREAGNAAE